jgi:aryl-alcohol dehydrogenase-like predicted oxidoreductase
MKYRELGNTGMKISEVSFGAWAIGADWGSVDDKDSLAALHRAIDLGINFIDTADVYGMGHSEKLIAQLRKERSEQIYVATKAGRKLDPHVAEKYTPENIRGFIEQSLKNLQVEALDLVQLHCPPTPVFYNREGAAFDRGETFAGVEYEKGLQAVEALERIKPKDFTMAQFALKWILMHDAVSCTIPGAKRAGQVEDNCRASDLSDLPGQVMDRVRDIYDKYVKADVHQRW